MQRRFEFELGIASAWALLATFALAASAGATPTYVTFDIPGATLIEPYSINSAGTVAGSYANGNAYYGFERMSDGTIIRFSPPGGQIPIMGSAVLINDTGVIAGTYQSNSDVAGFIRAIDGSFTTFQVPGSLSTESSAINKKGVVAGDWNDWNNVSHGYVRYTDGTIETFDPPGSGFTVVHGIDANGNVAGWYDDANARHGFIRATNGAFTIFDPPGSVGTTVEAMNAKGDCIGEYDDINSAGGFLRTADGAIITFAFREGHQPTFTGIDAKDFGAGYDYYNLTAYGFERTRAGKFVHASPKGATDTYAMAINDNRVITGVYDDANGVSHGFLRLP